MWDELVVSSSLEIIKQRVEDLVEDAKKIDELAVKLQSDLSVRQILLTEHQKWYRTVRALMKVNEFSGLLEFDEAYGGPGNNFDYYINYYDSSPSDVYDPNYENHFKIPFDTQVALLSALPSEIQGKNVSFLRTLSSDISTSELEEAQKLLENNFERAAGVVARVALERHIKTIYQTEIGAQPIPKFDQCIIELTKKGIFEERHRKHLAAIYNIGSDCAHAGKNITKEEIAQLIKDANAVVTTWK